MKRRIWIAWGLALLLVLSGCGASAKGETTASEQWDADSVETNATPGSPMGVPEEAMGGIQENAPEAQTKQPAKLIYRGSMEMETTAFDDASVELRALVERCGGHMQSSNLRYSSSGYRSAEYVVRVPAAQYRTFFTTAGELCHVTWKNEETEDVSMVYYDTAGRLKTQETKLTRLQELLQKAETMEDIITLESAISETEYAIDSLSGELRHYDDLVDYSTVTINLQEVYKLSNTGEPAESFGDRLGAAFRSGILGFAGAMESLAVGVAYAWVWLLLAAAILGGVVYVARRRQKGTPVEQPHFFKKNHHAQEPKA